MIKRPRKLPSIEFGKRSGKAAIGRQHQVDYVNLRAGTQKPRKRGQNSFGVGVGQMVKHAVDQGEIELSQIRTGLGYVPDLELVLGMALPGRGNVVGAEIRPQIAFGLKNPGVGAGPTSDIDDPFVGPDGMIGQKRCELLLD